MGKRAIDILLLLLIGSQNTKSLDSTLKTVFTSPLSFLEKQEEDWDSYPQYEEQYKPKLPINSTTNEDFEYNAAFDPAKEVDLPIALKQNIFTKATLTKGIELNFGEFLVGIASAWLHNLSFLREAVNSPGFNKDKCAIQVLWKKYQPTVQAKGQELASLLTKSIPGDILFKEKKMKCEFSIADVSINIDKDLESRRISIEKLQEQLKNLKNSDAIEPILKVIDIHQAAIKDYKKEQRQLRRIDCDKLIEDPNLTVKYSIMTMSAYLKDFIGESMACFVKAVSGRGFNALVDMSRDVSRYASASPLGIIARALTSGVYDVNKSMFHMTRLYLAVFNLFKAYKGKKWDDFAFQMGKTLGLSSRILLPLL